MRTSSYRTSFDKIEVITKLIENADSTQNDEEDFVNARDSAGSRQIQELDVKQTVIAEPSPPRVLSTLLTGLPSPTSKLWTAATVSINVLLVGFVLDMTYRAAWLYPANDLSFARVGFVSDSSAKILVREPDVKQLPLFMSYRLAEPLDGSVSDETWLSAGTVTTLSKATDFTTVLTISKLDPDTRYQFATSNNHTGYIISAPKPGTTSMRKEFQGKFSFLHTSCMKARFPFSLLDHPLTIPGLRSLSKVL